jgi:hypothetical protein
MVKLADLDDEKFSRKFTITSERIGELGFRALYGVDFPHPPKAQSVKRERTGGADRSQNH